MRVDRNLFVSCLERFLDLNLANENKILEGQRNELRKGKET